MEREEYFQKMRETSEIVDPLIIKSVDYLKETNKELYNFIVSIPAFKKRVEKKDKLRPFLLRLAYELAGGRNWKKIAYACAAVELLNISTYIDNAVFDNKNNIDEREKNNYVISARIIRNIAENVIKKVTKKDSETLISLLSEIDHDIYVAQFEDLNQIKKGRKFESMKNFLSSYLHRCEFLTGRFMENIAKSGAILAKATEKQLNDLGKIGRNIGIIDQIVNDIGDLVPAEENTIDYEKVYQDQFSDIKNGKLTLPIYYVLQFGSNEDKKIINKALGNKKASNEDLNNVAKVLIANDAIKYSKGVAREYSLETRKLLSNFEKSESRDLFKIMSRLHQTNKYIAAFRSFSKKIKENQEKIVLVDENDKPIGTEDKLNVHQKGKLHRAFSIFIFNSKGELLLQQRVKNKYHCGGLWSNTVCGHSQHAESLIKSAHKRLKKEMGFDCPLKEIFKFHYKIEFENGLIENEIDHVLVGRYDTKPKINKNEVSEFKWVSVKKLKQDISKNPNKYTFWFKKIIIDRF